MSIPHPKVISLSVRASQASHLCFEVGGILTELNAELGAPVTAFDFAAFYAILGSIPTIPGHPARLIYDFLQIQAFVKPVTLVALRAEPMKAALNKAINARANAYYAKYANAPAIISRIQKDYSPSISDSKPVRLEVLSSISQDQMEQLRDAYISDGKTNVVKTTDLESSSESSVISMRDEENRAEFDALGAETIGLVFTGPGKVGLDRQLSRNKGSAKSTDYGYRIPHLENLAQYERAQISLIDQQFAQFMSGQTIPYLTAVFQNELSSIDSDVFRLQIAYLNTILMSPIGGTVTGIYKSAGEAVRAGEPVMRVENNAEILLVATLIYRGPISIGSMVRVKTTLFDLPGTKTSINGPVVSVRGQGDDDQWEVIVKCNNLDGGGKPIFPLGYHFDYDDTTVDIS